MKSAQRIVILSPDSPDHDSVSSNIALAETLKGLGKKVQLLSGTPLPDGLRWIGGNWQYEQPTAPVKSDLTIVTDIGGIAQVEIVLDGQRQLVEKVPTLLIDHHATRDEFKFTVAVVDSKAAATGELLYNLYQQLGWKITPPLARLMLIGILGDTGGFQNLNVDANVLRVAASLVDLGGSVYHVNQEYVQSSSFTAEKFYVLMELASHVKFDGPIVYGQIPYAAVAKFGPNAGFTQALGELIRYLKGVRVSFVLSEKPDATLRLSMRSQPEFDVSQVTARFGGGGHKVAAGALIKDRTLAQAATEVVSLLKRQRQ